MAINRTSTTFAVPAASQIHLPWQGSWQVPARRLREPVDVQGAHLPLVVWEHAGQWSFARFTCGADDAPWNLRLQQRGDVLTLRLEGEWKTEPTWQHETCGDYAALLQRIRATLPQVKSKPSRPIRRSFVLDIHNVAGRLVQRFDDITRFVDQLATLGIAQGSMLYLPGWAGLYDGNYPEYVASPAAGGATALARLAEAARAHGAWVVPHFNHWALSCRVADQFPQFKAHYLFDETGRQAGWPGTALMDISHPLHYVDPSCEPWLDHFSARLSYIESLGIEAAYLDQVAPPLGENFRRQTRCFTQEIHRRHPNLLLGSESVHSEVVDCLGFAQLWGPVWSVMPKVPRLKASRILADVVEPWLTLVGHISMPAPYPVPYVWTHYLYLAEHGPRKFFREVWKHHEACGVVPTIRLVTTRRRVNERILKALFG